MLGNNQLSTVFSPVCIHYAEFIASGAQESIQSEFNFRPMHSHALDLASDWHRSHNSPTG